MKPMFVELREEGGFAGRSRRWAVATEQLPAPQAARLGSLLGAAWSAMAAPGASGAGPAVEPDDASAQTAPARDRQQWTLTCLRGDEELTCRVADGERLPDPVAALVRFVREAGAR